MKRFTDTGKWSDPWFRSLSPENKCLWQWLLDNCDCAGIIEIDEGLAMFQIGATKPLDSPLVALTDRVRLIGSKLFIPKFIRFQYGNELCAKNSAHKGVLKRLELAGIPSPVDVIGLDGKRTKGDVMEYSPYVAPSKPLQSPYVAPQDKDKDKGMDKVQGTTVNHTNLDLDISCPPPEDEIDFPSLIWSQAPKMGRERSSQKLLAGEWRKIKSSDRPDVETLNAALTAWNNSQKWHNGFAEGIHLWVRNQQWKNIPDHWTANGTKTGFKPAHHKDAGGMKDAKEVEAYLRSIDAWIEDPK